MGTRIKGSVERLESLLKEAVGILSELKAQISEAEDEEKEGRKKEQEEGKALPEEEKEKIGSGGSSVVVAEQVEQKKKGGIIIGDKEPAEKKSSPKEEKQKDEFSLLLERVNEVLTEAEKVFLSSEETAPLKKALAASSKVKEEGEKGEFALGVSVLIVRLLHRCFGSFFSSFRDKGVGALKTASEVIPKTLGAELFWKEGVKEEELMESVDRITVYSSQEKGSVVAFAEPSIRKEGKTIRKGKVFISAGEEHPISALCEKALETTSALLPLDEQSRILKSELLDELRKRQSLLYPLKEEHLTAQLRAILNPLDSALFVGRFKNPELLKNITERIVDELKQHGWRQIMVPVGGKFDDSFSPSKFERKFVKSDKPSGTIVGVIRRGFIDSSGVAAQKALLAISE